MILFIKINRLLQGVFMNQTVQAEPVAEQSRDSKHVYYFDYLRLIAAFCVVYMHVAASPLRNPITLGWQLNNAVVSFSFCAVPLFFMMSGYLILSSRKTSDVGILLKKRLPHLLVPLAFWTVTYAVFDNYLAGTLSFSSIKDVLINSVSNPAEVHLWYMYTLIAIYAVSPILFGGVKSLDGKGRKYIFVLISAVTVLSMVNILLSAFSLRTVRIDLFSKLMIFGGDLVIFVLGYFLGSTKIRIPNFCLIIFTVAVFSAITVGTHFVSASANEYSQLFQSQHEGFEVALAAGIFLLFKQNFNKPSRILKAVPIVPLTMSIYFSHLVFIYLAYRLGITNTGFKTTILMVLCVFIISYLFSKTAATIKPLCFLITGLRYKEACETCNWIYTYINIKKLISGRKNRSSDNA